MTHRRFLLALCVLLLLGQVLDLAAQAQDPTVYITRTGSKYHLDGCRYLRQSKIPIALSAAIARGYGPCSVCRPPTSASQSAPSPAPRPPATQQAPQQTAAQLYRVNVARLSSYRYADLGQMVPAKVVGHVDGDTVKVLIAAPPPGLAAAETIRFLGVDTPETVHPSKPVERFGKEASEFTRSRLLGQDVLLAFDWDLRDRYGRLLAYVYLPDGTCHNASLIQDGYGHAYTEFPFQFLEEFRGLEVAARNENRGLWKP